MTRNSVPLVISLSPKMFVFYICVFSTCQFLFLRALASTFWSQDIHSTFPFSTYTFPSPNEGHYSAQSAFKQGYQMEEKISDDLVKYTNYTGNIYGIIIDAGSTGTRLSAFHFVKALRPPFMRLVTECGKHLKPGLSYYAADPDKVFENIAPLIARAKVCIPKYLWSTTPLELKATAGLRLLPPYIQDELLNNVEDYLRTHSPFVLSHDQSVSIMEGIDEGLYSWITVNYMLNTLHLKHDDYDDEMDHEHSIKRMLRKDKLKRQTVGTLDLGGGSTQITFIPMFDWTVENAPEEYIHRVRIFGEKLKLYSFSYLGFGLMSARMQMFGYPREVPEDISLAASNRLQSVCIPPDAHFQWQHASSDYIVSTDLYQPNSDSRFSSCYTRAVQIVTQEIHDVPEVTRNTFYAFSYYYDLAVDSGIIQHVPADRIQVGAFISKAKEICGGPDVLRKPFLCMDLCYISALLIDGYGFRESQDLELRKKIEGVEASWALGAMFHLLNTFHNTSQIEFKNSVFRKP